MNNELEEEVIDGLNIHLLVHIFIIFFLPSALDDHPHRHFQKIVDHILVLKQSLHSLTADGLRVARKDEQSNNLSELSYLDV